MPPAAAADEVFRALSVCSPVGLILTDRGGRCTYTNPRYQAICGVPLAASLGDGWLESIHPDDRAAAAAAWAGIPGQEYEIEPRIVRPDGSVRRVHVRVADLMDDRGEAIGRVGTVDDVTERVEEQRRVERRLSALTRVAGSLTFDQSTEATLDDLAASVVEVTQATACAVTLIDEEQGLFRTAGTCGLPDGYAAAIESSYRAGALLASLEAYRTRRPAQRMARGDMLHDPHQTPLHGFVREAAWDALVAVPLVSRGRALGAMSCAYPVGREPDADEVAFLAAVADQAAVAAETAQLFAEIQGKAALEERQRLARELHDSVSQALFGIGLGARTARTLIDRDPAKAAEPLDYVVSLAEAGLTEMRALIFELRPDALETEGLVGLLEHQAAALRTRHALRVETTFGPEPVVSLAVKEMLYRIAQEALHNTTKHAQASSVTVLMREEPDGILLEVADDGVGFDPAGSFPGHLGLRSMRERASRLGASVEVESAPGRGTRTRVLAPPGP